MRPKKKTAGALKESEDGGGGPYQGLTPLAPHGVGDARDIIAQPSRCETASAEHWEKAWR